MKILRFSPTCDVEVDLQVNQNGMMYILDVRDADKGEITIGPIPSVEAFKELVEIHNDPAYKIPSKFVIEFAGYVISELKSQSIKNLVTGYTYSEDCNKAAGTA